MPLTLEDIARLSGVSRSTVSRVINENPNVREETRQKVQEVINAYGFEPNLAARGLATGRTKVIGIVIPANIFVVFSDPYIPLLLQGVSETCTTRNYSVMLWLAEPAYERRMISRVLYNGLVDGMIVARIRMDDCIIPSMIKSKTPFILVGRHPDIKVNYLDVDNIAAGFKATMHLIQLGYKSIATITGAMDQVSGYDRYMGYLKALQDSCIPENPDLVVEGDFTEEGGYRAMQQLLKSKPDAVFIASDMMALGAMHALRENGLRIPDDVALVGFDDIPSSARTDPPLTTIRQPILQMGSRAVEILIHLVETKTRVTQKEILDTELVIRESCGASKKLLKSISGDNSDP